MSKQEDADTRYYIEIDLESLKITKCTMDQKQNLDKGRQNNPDIHRLFLTKGQYKKFVARCEQALGSVLEK